MDDDEIRELVRRLARPNRSGGSVIERAAILAAGTDAAAVIAWILARGATPEATAAPTTSRGLHGPRLHESAEADNRPPSRFVLPAGALD
jgi:hypothetical protein